MTPLAQIAALPGVRLTVSFLSLTRKWCAAATWHGGPREGVIIQADDIDCAVQRLADRLPHSSVSSDIDELLS